MDRIWLRRAAGAAMYVALWMVLMRGIEGPIPLQVLAAAALMVVGLIAWIAAIFWLMFGN